MNNPDHAAPASPLPPEPSKGGAEERAALIRELRSQGGYGDCAHVEDSSLLHNAAAMLEADGLVLDGHRATLADLRAQLAAREAEVEQLKALWERFAGFEAGNHEHRSKCISDALGIEDQSTTKQCAAIAALREKAEALASEVEELRYLEGVNAKLLDEVMALRKAGEAT